MFTPEQEQFLATFADRGLAEQAEAQARQAELDKIYKPIEEAQAAKLAELQVTAAGLVEQGQSPEQAQQFVDNNMEEFKATVIAPMVEEATN